MGAELFRRKVEVLTPGRIFTFPELYLEFTAKFDSDNIPDEVTCDLYNLNDDSMASIQRGQSITINAGYGNDIGSVCEGVITDVTSSRSELDRVLHIKALNITNQYLGMKVNKSYAAGTSATFIMKDLASLLGLKFDILSVKQDVTYPRGYYANGTFQDVIADLVDDCNSLFIVTGPSLTIIPGWSGHTYGFAMDAAHGLISVEPLDRSDTPAKYKLTCLFTHGIEPYTFLDLKSELVSGRMLVAEGQHSLNGSDFTTECEVIPI
jgi:hypothetical protein